MRMWALSRSLAVMHTATGSTSTDAGSSGTWTHVQHIGNLINPGFLITSSDHRFLYSSHQAEKYISAFSIHPRTGLLTLLNRASTVSTSGVHQAIDPTGRFLLVAGYSTGNIAVLPPQTDGRVENAIETISCRNGGARSTSRRTDILASASDRV